jgi:FixJ family two-component response regulator
MLHYRAEMTGAEHQTHVALLDDDPSIRRALARLLEGEGMVVNSYATSDELFGALAAGSPDCLILDLQMPKTNGIDVLRQLERLGIRIPTVVLTAHEEAGSREACLNAGAAEFLRKPPDVGRLLQAIARVSGMRPDAASGQA